MVCCGTNAREKHDVRQIVIAQPTWLSRDLGCWPRDHCYRPAWRDRLCRRAAWQKQHGGSAENQARDEHIISHTEADRCWCLEYRLCRGGASSRSQRLSFARLAL